MCGGGGAASPSRLGGGEPGLFKHGGHGGGRERWASIKATEEGEAARERAK